jgi:Fic family protein
LNYFFRGVARQSEDALSRARRINEQIGRWRQALAGSRAAMPVIERLAANPFLTARNVQRELKTSYNTAARAIALLEKAGIVRQAGDARRDRVYCAQAVLDILEEPARLVPQEKNN